MDATMNDPTCGATRIGTMGTLTCALAPHDGSHHEAASSYGWVSWTGDDRAKRFAVTLDWANDVPDYEDPDFVSDPDGAVAAAVHGLTATVVDPHGPGGGWPIVRFEGTRDAILALVAEYDGDNGGESRDYIVPANEHPYAKAPSAEERASWTCVCGESIEQHTGKLNVCPDGIHEFEPRS